MIEIRKANLRGFVDKGSLKSFSSFSFGDYFDPKYRSFHSLIVLNEDILMPSKGYPEQHFKEIEIVTYVVEGAVEYRDSLANNMIISQGELARISAGSGISSSLFNLSHYQNAHLFHFWIASNQNGLAPKVDKRLFTQASKWGQWSLLLSNTGRGGSLSCRQDLDLYSCYLEEESEILFDALSDRAYWLQVVSGCFQLDQGEEIKAGDGVSFTEVSSIVLKAKERGELLLFDLA